LSNGLPLCLTGLNLPMPTRRSLPIFAAGSTALRSQSNSLPAGSTRSD